MIRGQSNLDRQMASAISGDNATVNWFVLANDQLLSQVPSIRLDDLQDQANFPAVPSDGYGIFYTPWGIYSAVKVSGTPSVKWLRLHTGIQYASGAAIPTSV